ncbi:kinase-like domain-containing protein [Russula compacta]|nr:kinase-like domain-containing protein [Russula compacta]
MTMTAMPERHAQSAGRQAADAQNGPWTVSIADDPHRPSSYILYVKTPTRHLTLSRTAREIVELRRNLVDTYPSIPLAAVSHEPSVLIRSAERTDSVHHTTAQLSSPASKIGSGISALRSVATNLGIPNQVAFPVDTSASAEVVNRTLASFLTAILSDPVFRQVPLWENFIRPRTYDLESALVERASSLVRPGVSTQMVSHSMERPRETLTCLKMKVSDFEMVCVLGIGSKGKILLAREKTRSNFYALKVIAKRRILAEDTREYTLTECAVLRLMAVERKNPFVIKLWRSFHDKESLYMAMDFHPGGDLATQLARWGRLDHDQCRFYAAEIVEGIEGLHTAGVIHRNLKPEHILIDRDGHIVLCGFGACKRFPLRVAQRATSGAPPTGDAPYWIRHDNQLARPWQSHRADATGTLCGTAEYLAPEVIKGLPYGYEVDWWSFGTILYEILTGIRPFDADNMSSMYDRILQDEDELQFPHYQAIDQGTQNFIRGLLERDPTLRLSEPQIKPHPYFSMIDWADVYDKRYIPPYIPSIEASNPSNIQNFEDIFLNMKPVISDEISVDTEQEGGKIDPGSTDGEDSIAAPPPLLRLSPSHLPDDTVDIFEGYSFRDLHSDMLGDELEGEPEDLGPQPYHRPRTIRSGSLSVLNAGLRRLMPVLSPLRSPTPPRKQSRTSRKKCLRQASMSISSVCGRKAWPTVELPVQCPRGEVACTGARARSLGCRYGRWRR